jgi:hypothetical protein
MTIDNTVCQPAMHCLGSGTRHDFLLNLRYIDCNCLIKTIFCALAVVLFNAATIGLTGGVRDEVDQIQVAVLLLA